MAAVFDDKEIMVIYVLGGPGAGKGTQCARLVEDFGFCHLSAGDVLRAEQNREESTYGTLIRTCIREGNIVPVEITVKLLQNAMEAELEKGKPVKDWPKGKGLFLIDGFPRKMDQAIKFDEEVCLSAKVLFFNTTEEVMLERLLERGKTSGREDDNIEVIKKRFKTYQEQTMPVIKYYDRQGKVKEIDSSASVEAVHKEASIVVKQLLEAVQETTVA